MLIKTSAQKTIGNEATAFGIKHKNQIIDFIVFDPVLDKRKPVMLWCQGSLPYPLYVDSAEEGLWIMGGGITNFDIEAIKKSYHLVVVSMPETPLIAQEDEINASYWYYGDSFDKNIPAVAFQKADYLENYVERATKVLRFLRRQRWVDPKKLVVAGHSQGAKVATKVAAKYKAVSMLGVFSPNPFGRIDENIRKSRKKAEQHLISWQEADNQINEEYKYYEDTFSDEKIAKQPGLRAWQTFSEPMINDWLDIKKPLYLAYGTHDIASELCDLVPLFFIRERKNNLTFRRYLQLNHNFQFAENISQNQTEAHWEKVMNDFIEWTLRQ